MLSKRTKGLLWKIWTVSPILVGLVCLRLLYSRYDVNATSTSILNIHTWGIMAYSPVNEFALLHMLLVSNIVIVALGTAVYITEIFRGLNNTSVKGGLFYLIFALLIAVGAIGLCGVWIMFYYETSRLAAIGVDSEVFASALIGHSDLFVIAVFLAFGVSDWLLAKGYDRDSAQCLEPANKSECNARKRFAHDALILIDLPVLLGSLVLWLVANMLLSNSALVGLGPRSAELLAKAGLGTDGEQNLSRVISSTFAGGFSLGSIICQLAYSQFVFTVLNFRVTEAASIARGEVDVGKSALGAHESHRTAEGEKAGG